MNRVVLSRLFLAAAATTLVAASVHAVAVADVPPPPPPAWKATNLQVLPPNMPRDQLVGIMRKMSQSLGVNCSYCHVMPEGKAPNFASDIKREKEMARWMMRVTYDLNQKFEVDMNAPEVTCYTCHRGATKPLVAPPLADLVPAASVPPKS